MLLYDRVRLCDKEMPEVPVYEISNVLHLTSPYVSKDYLEIPRRPPHEGVWVEWWDTSDGEEDQIGTLIEACPDSIRDGILNNVTLEKLPTTEKLARRVEIINDTKNSIYYLSRQFRYSKTGNLLMTFDSRVLWGGRQNMQELGYLVVYPTDGVKGEDPKGMLMVPTKLASALEPNNTLATDILPWPAFMAFALLHCRNIKSETIDAPPQKPRHARQGVPKRCSYKILKLEVPLETSRKANRGVLGNESSSTRLHICRGHFKNLQHDRYKNKGWHWWPAHWRGDASLGEIVKTYEMTGR